MASKYAKKRKQVDHVANNPQVNFRKSLYKHTSVCPNCGKVNHCEQMTKCFTCDTLYQIMG